MIFPTQKSWDYAVNGRVALAFPNMLYGTATWEPSCMLTYISGVLNSTWAPTWVKQKPMHWQGQGPSYLIAIRKALSNLKYNSSNRSIMTTGALTWSFKAQLISRYGHSLIVLYVWSWLKEEKRKLCIRASCQQRPLRQMIAIHINFRCW